jgi:glyoxylase-like metal-dependent hydrolase (beta-lactamase superfamily II)
MLGGHAFDSNMLVLEGDRPVLVDTGTGVANDESAYRLRKVLKGRKLDRIVLTHRHIDHSGGAAGLSKELDAPVYIHEAGVEGVASADAQKTGAWMFGTTFEPVEAQPLREGDVVDTGGARFEVLHTPGHSPDAIALWHEPSRTLVPGDTVYADGGVGRWDLPGGDYKELVASIQRLADLEPEKMYPGHGPEVIHDAVEHVRMGLRAVRLYGGG